MPQLLSTLRLSGHHTVMKSALKGTGCAAEEATTQTSELDTRHLRPDPEGTCAHQVIVNGSQQVTAETEQIQDDAVNHRKRCACAVDLNRRICRSRYRVGW